MGRCARLADVPARDGELGALALAGPARRAAALRRAAAPLRHVTQAGVPLAIGLGADAAPVRLEHRPDDPRQGGEPRRLAGDASRRLVVLAVVGRASRSRRARSAGRSGHISTTRRSRRRRRRRRDHDAGTRTSAAAIRPPGRPSSRAPAAPAATRSQPPARAAPSGRTSTRRSRALALVVDRVTNGQGRDAAVQGPADAAADQGRRRVRRLVREAGSPATTRRARARPARRGSRAGAPRPCRASRSARPSSAGRRGAGPRRR